MTNRERIFQLTDIDLVRVIKWKLIYEGFREEMISWVDWLFTEVKEENDGRNGESK